MRKNEMITIYNLNGEVTVKNQGEFEDEVLETFKIKINNNFLFRMFFAYRNITIINNGFFTDDIIKVDLPSKERLAYKILMEGLIFNDEEYLPLITSPTLMKQENIEWEEDSKISTKCTYLFIKKEYIGFKEIFENCISFGKATEKRNNEKKLCINKDIIARLSLALSGSYRIAYKPSIVVLPEKTYQYTSRYVSFNEENELVPICDKGKDTLTQEHTFADGAGFMSPKLAEIIQNDLNVDYTVDFAVIRHYAGLAVKGLVVKVDFIKYFEDNYKADTDTFWKDENGYFWVIDYFGQPKNISKADLILNTSQVKWAKWWKKENEVVDIDKEVNRCLENPYVDNYRDLLNSLYVTKINKKEPNTHSRTNYQLISNLALTPSELRQLSESTEQYFKDIVSNQDIDKTRLFLGDIARNEEQQLSASTKVHYLLQANENFAKTKICNNVMNRLTRKKIKQIQGGRFYVKGNYKILAPDFIAYLNWIMTSELKGGIGEHEFYVPQETGKRTLSRNPLNSFSEIQKINLVQNESLNKYFGNHTSELLFLNAKDDTAMLMSGADEDGDMALCVDNDIIYNSVVPKYEIDGLTYDFINLADGDKKEEIFTEQTLLISSYQAAGNKIGKLSNLGIVVSNAAQEFSYKILKKDGVYVFRTYNQMYKKYKEKHIDDVAYSGYINKIKQATEEIKQISTKEEIDEYLDIISKINQELDSKIREEFKNHISDLLEKGRLQQIDKLSNEEYKQQIINQFHKYTYISYYALKLQMMAIDAPKTGKFDEVIEGEKALKEVIKSEFGNTTKPTFIQYSKAKKIIDEKERARDKRKYRYTHSLLNNNISQVRKNVYNEDLTEAQAEKKNEKSNDAKTELHKTLLFNNADMDFTCLTEVKNLFHNWKKARNKWTTKPTKYRTDDDKNKIKEIQEKYLIEDRSQYLDILDLNTIKLVKSLQEKYNINQIAKGLINADADSQFILNCCWDILKVKVDEQFSIISQYIENNDGEYKWLFKRYKKVNATRKGVDFTKEQIDKLEKRLCKKIKFKLEVKETDMDLSSVIFKKNNNGKETVVEVYDNDGLMTGIVYRDHVKKCVYDKKVEIIKNTIKESTKKTGETYKYVELECKIDVAS